MDAMAFLDKGGKPKKQPVWVVAGDEDFLKRRCLHSIQELVLGDADPSFALSSYPGDKADFATIRSELDTLPFLCDVRLVIVEKADDRGRRQSAEQLEDADSETGGASDGSFLSKYRANLEKYVAAPSATGVLVLDVKSWPATTRLAKMVPDAATIDAKSPKPYLLPAWCVQWAQTSYGKKLAKASAEMLIELVGPHMGLLDAELQKLAIYAGDKPSIETKDIDALVGRNAEANVFKIMDAVGDGKPDQALAILNDLFESGEVAVKILGALGFQIRRLAATASLHKQGAGLEEAFDRAGVAKWPQARDAIRKQMKHLGWNRLDKLYDWLVETDLGIKGGSHLPDRLVLEQLIVRLARARS